MPVDSIRVTNAVPVDSTLPDDDRLLKLDVAICIAFAPCWVMTILVPAVKLTVPVIGMPPVAAIPVTRGLLISVLILLFSVVPVVSRFVRIVLIAAPVASKFVRNVVPVVARFVVSVLI